MISVRASELFRLEICPGSYRMQKGLPDEDTELSKKGSMLHWHDAHPEIDRAFLKPADQDLLAKAKSLDDIVIQRVTDQFDLKEKAFTEARETFGKYSDDGFEVTGHPDRIRFYDDGPTVIFEKKYGFLEQSPAEVNKQLRAYSLIFANGESVVSLLQPRKPFYEQITIAHYTKSDIESSREEVAAIVREVAKPDAPLNPTEDGCRYCRARLICSARQAYVEQGLSVITPGKELSKAAREAWLLQKLSELPDDQLEKVIAACSLAKMVSSAANDEVRRRGGTEHLTFVKDSEVREVVDVRKAMAMLSLQGFTRTEQYECVEGLSLTKVEEVFRKKNPNWTWQQARDKANKILQSVIEITNRKGRIMPK